MTRQKPEHNDGQWLSLYPADSSLRVVTDVLWSRAEANIPMQRVEHLWAELPGVCTFSRIRLTPVPGKSLGALYDTENRPRRVILQTARDGGKAFRTLKELALDAWTGPDPIDVRLPAFRVDNVRIVIPRADKMAFPAYPYVRRIELFVTKCLPKKQGSPVRSIPLTRQDTIAPLDPARVSDRVIFSRDGDRLAFQSPTLRMEFSRSQPQIAFLGWDLFNNTNRQNVNLLCGHGPSGAFPCIARESGRAPVRSCSYMEGSGSRDPVAADPTLSGGVGGELSVFGHRLSYRNMRVGDSIMCDLHFDVREQGFDLEVDWRCRKPARTLQVAALRFAFDLQRTVSGVFAMPNTTGPLGLVNLPALIHAPDHGSMQVVQSSGDLAFGAVHAHRHRSELWFDLIVGATPLESGLFELRPGRHRGKFEFRLSAIFPYCTQPYGDFRPKPMLSVPESDSYRSGLVRGWMNGLAFRPDIGVFANNSVSDAALYCQRFYGDFLMATPMLAPGLDPRELLRFCLEQILNGASFWSMDNTRMPGNVGSVLGMLWNYLAASQNWGWAEKHLPLMRDWVRQALNLHRHEDGMIREHVSGNGEAHRSGISWWDAVMSGGREAFNSALAHRELLRAAQIMDKLGQRNTAADLRNCAARLRKHYRAVFYDPATGWIGNWRGGDGKLRNFGNLAMTGAAVVCGALEPAQGTPMLKKLLAKLVKVGFTRFDWGFPQHLIPVPQKYYCLGYGMPIEPDSRDMYGIYQNGAATTSQAYWFIQALYCCGLRNQANAFLKAMCDGFYAATACGPLNSGVDWKRWDGRPAGYEGLLVDQFHVLLAVLTGYLGLDFTIDGVKTPPNSGAQWLKDTFRSCPDFCTLIKGNSQ